MNPFLIVLLGSGCGLLSACVMNLFMRKIGSTYSKRLDMTEALGSYFTGTLKNAGRIGTAIHSIAGILFGIIYLLIFNAMHALVLPYSIFLGIGFGFFHGLITSYCLMFYASERHPIEAYRKATLEEGLLHLIGHVIFGGALGLSSGLLVALS